MRAVLGMERGHFKSLNMGPMGLTKRCSSLALTSCGVDNPVVASC
jgi:hypothetical protein